MPDGRGSSSPMNRELYEELRNEGVSMESAKSIAIAVARDRDRTDATAGATADSD